MKALSHGFTLVELLVALALTGLVSLLMLDGVRNASVGVGNLLQKADRLDRRYSIEALLRFELGSAVAKPLLVNEPGFVGRRSSLEFLTLAGGGGAGLYHVDLEYLPQRDDRLLLLTRRLADSYFGSDIQQSVLGRLIRGFHIAYFGVIPPDTDPAWHDQWEEVTYPPRMLRIEIDTGDGFDHPPIIIRLRAVSR